MVTICTASLTFNNSMFCPHSVFMCFVWIWEQTAIISLYNINCLVFITVTQCVYCAVRTGYLNIIRFFSFGCAKTLSASFSHLALPPVHCGRQSSIGTVLSPTATLFTLSISVHQRSTLIFTYSLLLPEGQRGEALGYSRTNTLLNTWEHLIRNYFQFSSP